MPNDNSNICFVIAPIGELESDTRKRSDQILRHIIRPAVEAKGFTAVRADEISEPGIITSQVIQHIVDDPLVVADLTERNPNVFYELAVRHAIRKPFVQIINKGESLPFDVAATRTVFVDHHDLDNVETAKSEIMEQINALESDSSTLETPISVSLDLQHLRRSENPGERSLADVLSELSNIRSVLSDFEERVVMGSSGSMNRRDFRHLEELLVDTIHQASLVSHPSRKRRRVDPFHIMKIIQYIESRNKEIIALPILLSFLREDAPWVHAIGMEGYRQISVGSKTEGRETMRALLQLIDFAPETIDVTPELHMIIEEMRRILIPLLEETIGGYDPPHPGQHRTTRS